MFVWASGLRMGVGRFLKLQGGVEVQEMLDAELDAMQYIESVWKVLLCTGVRKMIVAGVAVGVCSERGSVADGVELNLSVISVWKILGATTTDIYYPCYHSVTVASYIL
jgi:hypothetical protein